MLEIVSWDGNAINDGTNYIAGFSPGAEWGLPDVKVQTVKRVGAWPMTTGLGRDNRELSIFVSIEDCSNVRTLRGQLMRWFDPEDEDPKALVITDDDTSVNRYVMAVCQQLRPINIGPVAAVDLFRIDLVVDGDVRWRAVTETSDVWSITASGDTNVIDNDGEDEVYPVYTIEPTSGKTGEYDYRRWVPIKWRSQNAGARYPVRAELDTATIVTAGDMQADGDDLRVYADGEEIDRWLDDMDSATTGIWFNLDFNQAPQLTLATAIAGAGDVASIEVDDEVELSLLPGSGTVLIDDEAFVYTARNLIDKQLTGITREAKGTTAAAHDVGDTVHWIQHDVLILYGNGSATAPTVDDDYKPMFELDHSDNEEWVYESFGDGDDRRSASWLPSLTINTSGVSGCYTATEKTLADPYTVAGVWIDEEARYYNNVGGWQLYNPCGIVNAAWSNGKMWSAETGDYTILCHLSYWVRGDAYYSDQRVIRDETAVAETWEAWSEAAAVADWDPVDTLSITLHFWDSAVEVSDVTVSLNASEVPVVAVNAEQGNYELGCTLTNETTGEAISIDFRMDINSELEIDTDERTIIWLEDDSRQLQARTLSSARRHWLRLLPGNNTLRFDDTGTGNVTLTTEFERRYY